ncbi:hypothetical protein KH5_10260 [Urechidicola sp. KH5]
MKTLFQTLLIVVLIVSCTSNTIYEKPDDLIPQNEMVDLLYDIQIAFGAKSSRNINGDYGVNYMPLVYEKYQIDSARFASSSFYYSTRPDLYSKLMRNVKERLEIKEREIEDQVRELDSIRDAKADPSNSRKIGNRDSIRKMPLNFNKIKNKSLEKANTKN